MYGHIASLARAVKQGVDSVEGVEGILYQVAETLPAEVLVKMHAPAKPEDVPVANPSTIDAADGFVFGFPTRFGMMCAQMKAFFDATGGHWQKGSLAGKAASMFTSTASQGSGQETTIMTAVTQLAHHGMIYVPTGYGSGGAMFGLDAPKGGSPWGAGTLAGGDGSRQPSEVELEQAVFQGKNLAAIVKKLTA
ncbi:flavo protein-like protein [Scenedesmus sp. NREL 46B-D3]|nr:flavo protein-like protein [Scenedesmus sp. NREL 46B-D3]